MNGRIHSWSHVFLSFPCWQVLDYWFNLLIYRSGFLFLNFILLGWMFLGIYLLHLGYLVCWHCCNNLYSSNDRASLVAQQLKHLPGMRETRVQSLGWEDPLEKEMATHSSTLAWRIPWMEEPGRLQSMGLQRVRHDWATSFSLSLSMTGKPGMLQFMG